MNKNEVKIQYPYCYHSMAAGNKQLFINYVRGYVINNYPGMRTVRIERNFVVCEVTPERSTQSFTKRKKPTSQRGTDSKDQNGLEL